jgi:hypothetical protein
VDFLECMWFSNNLLLKPLDSRRLVGDEEAVVTTCSVLDATLLLK